MDGKPFFIVGTETSECPVSSETESVRSLIDEFSTAKLLKELTGATLRGTNIDKWPARLVDTFVILGNEEKKVDNLRLGSKK